MGVFKLGKVPIVLVLLSIALLALSIYLKPQQIVGKEDLKVPKIEVPELPQISERKVFSDLALTSPLGEKELMVVQKKSVEVKIEKPPPKVMMVYKGRESYALFGEEIRKEGESLGEFVVEGIKDNKVLLREKKGGKRLWVSLDGY